MMTITNTMTGKKELFIPLQDENVTLYVCGITPYDFAHIGHGRCYVTFDLLYRVLSYLGYKTTYCRNFTDIDDKIIKKAISEYGNENRYTDIAHKFIQTFQEDLNALGCLPPTYQPKVTDHIPDIIRFIENLIAKGIAYVASNDVYFSIDQYEAYGKLSKRNKEDLLVGVRIQVEENKKNPLDFALWKSEPEGHFWESPWGYGRPGWHIECSVLAATYLGKQIDIHAGGMDLIFPHHENEIAQSEGLFGMPFAKYWMHNGFVQINKEKMSKSIGNFFTLRDIFTHIDPMVLRFYFLNHHYRTPLEFSFDDLRATRKSYQRLCRAFASKEIEEQTTPYDPSSSRFIPRMIDFLCEDLNSAGMIGTLFEQLSYITSDHVERSLVKAFIQKTLGLTLEPLPEKEIVLTEQAEKLIAEREQARKEKNWARADIIREKLRALGVEIRDKKAM